jgi:protein-S-isoprenylcysteine O-methyltransferase Ste14/uncharacterized membrane protein (UPF0127 family)
MPLKNVQNGKVYPFRVLKADTLLPRLIGLLATEKPYETNALHLVPCSGIHTFGMKYPVDVLFLDKDSFVIRVESNFPRNRTTGIVPSAGSVLELPPGSVVEHEIMVGTQFQIVSDEKFRVDGHALRYLFHWPLNIFIALLWSRFVAIAVRQWLSDGNLQNLGILIHNTLLFFLFLVRRKSTDTSRRLLDWLVPVFILACTMVVRPVIWANPKGFSLADLLQGIGIFCMVVSLLSLGRSFGIVPSNRRIVDTGVYRWVRHPMYASEFIFYLGYFLRNISVRNAVLITIIVAGQVWRSLAEEKLLMKDPRYRQYFHVVRFRFIPGLL